MSITGPNSQGFSPLGLLDTRPPGPQTQTDSAQAGQRPQRQEAQAPVRDTIEAEDAPAPADPQSIFAALALTNSPPANADAARLLALSVRQGLQEQSASIANLRPNSVLQYLRA
jgi:hypothetical protein